MTNMMVSIEQHVDWIGDCLAHMAREDATTCEAEPKAEEDWVKHVRETAEATLHVQASSWYMGANIPGKPRVFMPYVGGFDRYKKHSEAIAAKGYEGFAIG